MAKVKIEVLDAVIDGKSKGETLQVDERSAKHYEAIGYARLVESKQTKSKPKSKSSEKGKSAPKKDEEKSETDKE